MKLTRLSPPAERQASARAQRPAAVALTLTALVALLALALPLGAAGGSDTSPPSTPTGVVVSGVTTSSLALSWEASTDNVGVVHYRVFWLDSSSAGSSQAPPWPPGTSHRVTSETTVTLSELSCGKTYVVGVSAADAAENESDTAKALVSTAPCFDVSAPTPPSQLTQVASTETSATLSWQPSQDNFGVAGYRVYVGSLEVGQAQETSYTFAGLSCGTNTSVGVEAYDAAGNRSQSTPFVVTTRACPPGPPPPPPPPPPVPGSDSQPPTVPGNLRVVSSGPGTVTVAWQPSTDNVAVAGYGAYENGTRVDVTSATTYVFTQLQCGQSTTVGIDAYDTAGNRSGLASAIVSGSPCTDNQAPTHPRDLVRVLSTQTSISIRWGPATDNVGVTAYGVYAAGARVGTTSALDYTITNLACGQSYTVGVEAYDASGNRSSRPTALMSTSACGDTSAPPPPTALTASSATETSLKLTWSRPATTQTIAGYDVFANGLKVGTTSSTSFTLTALACGKSYDLGVEAFDAAANRSGRATTTSSTAACSVKQPGTPDLFVAPGGQDGGPCQQSNPCGSLNRAYELAQPGDVVQVAGGTYPGQVILGRSATSGLSPGCEPANTESCVTFRPAPGETVQIDGELEVHGSSVYVDGTPGGWFGGVPTRGRSYRWNVAGYVAVQADSESLYPDHVVLEGIHSTNFGAFGVDTVTFKDMDVGPATVTSGCGIREGIGMENKIGYGTGIPIVPTNVTIDGVIIHNQNGDEGRLVGNCHFGGLFLVSVNGLVIRNSVFSQNVVYNIQVQNFSGPPATNVTIENTWFGCSVDWLYVSDTQCANQADIQFNAASGFSNWLIRNNSFSHGIGEYVPGAAFSNVTVVGNAGGGPSLCYYGMSFSHNAWVETKCGSTDKSLPASPFVNPYPGSEDFHLRPGSGAIDVGDPSNFPSSDIDGESRPKGGAPDAGADEAG